MTTATLPRPATTSPAPASQTDSARRAGGPEDRALYQCACGTAFTASVSTSVGCPSCGGHQDW